MYARRVFLVCVGLILLVCLVAACSPSAPSDVMTTEPEQPVAEEPAEPSPPAVEAETALPTSAEEPSEAEPIASPPPPSPTLPVPTQPGPTPTPIIEQRLVEVEWPPRMRLGDSDVVRLALIPTRDGYTITTEFPEHQIVTQTVQVPRHGGFDLFAVARLDGVGFDISPPGEHVQYVPPDQALIWRWSLTPRSSGQQRLSVMLALRWVPTMQPHIPVREVAAYSTGLDVQVVSFFGFSRAQAVVTGLLGLVFGGGLSLVALVYRPRVAHPDLRTEAPNLDLVVEMPPGLQLSGTERRLLQTLFRRYTRLVIESEFLSGYSGARTFLALPIRADGRADAYTIAKLGERESIRREFENYETFVKDTLPPVTARIQHPPVAAPTPDRHTVPMVVEPSSAERRRMSLPGRGDWGGRMAALQYTFIGEPGSTPTSLRQALLKAPESTLLVKLFETFGPNWWMQRKPYTFRLAREYDRMLPTHLVLEPVQGKGRELDGRNPPAELDVQVGDIVRMRNLSVEELRADGRSLSLQGEPAPGLPPLRVRWLSLESPNGATGRVIGTRQTLLRDFVQGFDLFGLPDPFTRLQEFLGETVSGTVSTAHGDLNLENILVGPGDLVWLIDFARTRDAHTLFDFAHLEAEIIAHVMAPQIPSPDEYLVMLQDPGASPYSTLYELRFTIYEIAQRCLFNSSNPREYHLALTMACLGALKFVNLGSHAKHLLYLSAAQQIQTL